MTVRYVGSGGSDAAAGTSWATRKLTLNGAEDTPVVAGDIVYVGPGVYREQLTVDVSGSAGNPIVYVADVTGEHTDGIGGLVRVAGSNNDITPTRTQCLTASAKHYRTFRGFWFDTPVTYHLMIGAGSSGANNWFIEDCVFSDGPYAGDTIELMGNITDVTIRRCIFMGEQGKHVVFYNGGAAIFNTNNRVENCVFVGGGSAAVYIQAMHEMSVVNNLFFAFGRGVQQVTNSASHTVSVYGNIFTYGGEAIRGVATGDVTEDYNAFYGNSGNLFNTTAGGNSVSSPMLLNPLMLLDGFKLPQYEPWSLSQYSALRGVLDSATSTLRATADLYGLPRAPYSATYAVRSRGPTQYRAALRSTAQAQAGTTSAALHPGGLYPLRRVPVSAVSITIALYVYWESDYDTGGPYTKPRMVIRQPGQTERITTAVGSAGSWQQLTDTFTPSATPPYVDVCVESSTAFATAATSRVFVDSLTVT